jgi:hypothetical protein
LLLMTWSNLLKLLQHFFWFCVGCGAIAMGALFVDSAPPVPPAIGWFHPLAGAPGTRVVVVGKGFAEASLVTFAGVRAPFTLVGPLAIRVTVPRGAAPGPITVTTPLGTAASSDIFQAQ